MEMETTTATLDETKDMIVVKRSGKREAVSFDKILSRVKKIGEEFKLKLNYTSLVIKVIDQLHDNISTSKIDELTAEQAASLSTKHPDYGVLSSALVVSNLQKNTSPLFSDAMNELANNNLVTEEFITFVNLHKNYLNGLIVHSRDYLIDYFGFKTLERAYLMHFNKKIIERPQYMWMRVAIFIHLYDLNKIKTTYNLLSQKYFTHATPTLYNAGTHRPQLSSCFLVAMEDDSVDGIYNTLKECAIISQHAGGIGLHIHNIRATGSHIKGTNGTSNGIVPMLGVFNKTARYIDQGGGKRAGSFAIYIEPHHPDIEDFLDLKKNHGDEELRARDLFYALWISDLFMERVHTNSKWSLFCPNKTPGLEDCYGEEYKKLYNDYESKKLYIKQINARDLWLKILDSQIETGTPYMLYKDHINSKTNQKNLGTIKSSNLCTEITEYSNKNETAVCNLASIGLTKFVKYTENPFTNVTIYVQKNCSQSLLLKGLLTKRKISFKECVIDNGDEEDYNTFKTRFGVDSLPQLVDNNYLVGGYQVVENLLRNKFDYEELHSVAKIVTENLNKIIDINYYPTIKTKRSNLYHRPIGIGVQGLSDVFLLLDYPFESAEAKNININIFKTIYHAALEQSNEIAKERQTEMNHLLYNYRLENWNFKTDSDLCTEYTIYNRQDASIELSRAKDAILKELLEKHRPIRKEVETEWNTLDYCASYCGAYSSFENSPAHKGILQFDMWNVDPAKDSDSTINYDWDLLKENIKKYGLRNSLLVAPMPTASTSQILGNNECFEPLTSNIYSRRTLAGEFVLANKYLIEDLISLGIWDETIKNNIIQNKGSVQYIESIPKQLKEKYKIVWEMSMKNLIDMSRDRGAYICQSQSLNLWVEEPNHKVLTSMHFYSWKQGLKTGLYYLRRKARHQPQQFTIEPELNKNKEATEGCLMCSG
jgi:ribonucleoside-diphosphate reductase alpha subunit